MDFIRASRISRINDLSDSVNWLLSASISLKNSSNLEQLT